MHKLEYLWLDGCTPTQIRHKTKIVRQFGGLDGAPIWGFDGSSTEQADGSIFVFVFYTFFFLFLHIPYMFSYIFLLIFLI